MATEAPYITKLRSIPKENFLYGPSPIQHLPRLSAHLSSSSSSSGSGSGSGKGGVQIWAKREDSNSGLAYGGNKVRKLEYLVADALSQGCDTLVSVGGVQSNHTRAVNAVAAARGLKAITLQQRWVPVDAVREPQYDRTGNILLSRLMGGDVRLDAEGFGIEHKEGVRRVVEEVQQQQKKKDGVGGGGGARKPYYIPAGASDHPLGGLGFVGFVLELAEQEKALGVFFDTLVVCSVTGSSHAGLVAGAVAEGRGRRVIGIDASGKPAETRAQVLRIARNTAKLLDEKLEIADNAVELDERFHEGIYGIPGDGTIEAMKLVARLEALITDPVYEGKSMAGLIQLVKEGNIKDGSNVLYVHLGGQPALNAYSSYFE